MQVDVRYHLLTINIVQIMLKNSLTVENDNYYYLADKQPVKSLDTPSHANAFSSLQLSTLQIDTKDIKYMFTQHRKTH